MKSSKKQEEHDALRQLVRRSIERRHQVLVYEMAKKYQSVFGDKHFESAAEEAGGDAWVRIESLSRLRALVGGRFQNLKDRWVRAGFPLREHRGDRSGKKNFDFQGWVQLSAWIHKQGFELRLAEEAQPWLFEIRKVGKQEK